MPRIMHGASAFRIRTHTLILGNRNSVSQTLAEIEMIAAGYDCVIP